ncbi:MULTISPECIES: hypothetical protein [unclassified Variovorax]|nr:MULTISPECIES: hypothetical protein [unclassified Variovorax]PNG55643.1 hypothetical protein CHC07_02053 [Variovorax sp. B4]PNG57067.1 hypothetical protein CHC06_02056 [Variovorax sp. B2]VTV10635.1 hypothetical protein WDL1CHR_01575 [Variovorax sp. WDL1]
MLTLLPDVETVEDIKAWVGALTPGLCEACPDLLPCLSDRLAGLLVDLTPRELGECVKLCMDTASSAKQAFAVWPNLCGAVHRLSPLAMQTLLACLHDQQRQGQLPQHGLALIDHVQAVVAGVEQTLPGLGFAVPSTTRVVPIESAPVALEEDEIIVIDTGSDRHALQALGATTDGAPMKLPFDVLQRVMAHVLRDQGIDWMRPEYLPPEDEDSDSRAALVKLALVDKEFFACFSPKLANHPWKQMVAHSGNSSTFGHPGALQDKMHDLVRELVDLDAQTVASMLPSAPGVTQRRLDLVLRALLLGSIQSERGVGAPMQSAYRDLHNRAMFQLLSRSRKMSPCFAQHIDLSALPLQFLTMAHRTLGPGKREGFERLVAQVNYCLPAYPTVVQAQTLLGLLSMLPLPKSQAQVRSRLQELILGPGSWPAPAYEWLYCQWEHLDDMLALIANPDEVIEVAAPVANALLAALQRYHGVSDEPALLIDDPFGERYVLWSLADIRLLGALCRRANASGDWPPGLVDCLADLLRQFCSVTVPYVEEFAGPGFMEHFPADILRSAFLRLTPHEQGQMLIRRYSPDGERELPGHMELIRIFGKRVDIDPYERLAVLEVIPMVFNQHPQCNDLVALLIEELEGQVAGQPS